MSIGVKKLNCFGVVVVVVALVVVDVFVGERGVHRAHFWFTGRKL